MRDSWMLFYARVGFVGKSPAAPGTCASLVAILLAPFLFMPLPLSARIILLTLIWWLGVRASDRAEQLLDEKDPKQVVIDEVFGQWLTCLPFAALSLWEYAAAFVFFRIFDIFKPWPVSAAEQLPGGVGIMADDGVAGVYATLCLAGLQYLLLYFKVI
jgi:phosphatidylglycerophosphatase A